MGKEFRKMERLTGEYTRWNVRVDTAYFLMCMRLLIVSQSLRTSWAMTTTWTASGSWCRPAGRGGEKVMGEREHYEGVEPPCWRGERKGMKSDDQV